MIERSANRLDCSTADQLRIRICLEGATEPVPLHETRLSAEFQVSRTPIRQILQMLRREDMVEIRPGIGTVSTTLDPERRAYQGAVLETLVTAEAQLCAGQSMPLMLQANFASVRSLVEMRPLSTLDDVMQVMARMIATLEQSVADLLLRNATRAALWRQIRWLIRDAQCGGVSDAAVMDTIGADIRMIAEAGLKGPKSYPFIVLAQTGSFGTGDQTDDQKQPA
ncbi:GntR family transcriptional regulator [Roseisalinus antarcticus]|uniref:Bacterial regulatory proteins, gntR family n=1 Tax=Roseisalinus antarcticus TaxID=254357 RepID=A0A1Y5TXY6_9RHOB|nr:GntR family transcriptional regulator [Roseisalinus antarcticus]SLN76613.1 Bacterial regulatory proteins, gntR family [Roseisalinus antarcticus]